MKRLFPNQAEAIANALHAILEEKKRASRVLEYTVEQHPKWGSRDRNLLYQAVYTILRFKRKYTDIAGVDNEKFLVWPWIKTWCILNEYSIPNWKEMDCPPFLTKGEVEKLPFESSAIEHSFPSWLHQHGEKGLGSLWETEMKALNTKAEVSLRVNRILISPEKLAQQLKADYHIDTVQNSDFPDALFLTKGKKLNKNPLFRRGYFEIQDANSQQIAPFCGVKPEINVIDLCAGAGGKSLHLAALMRNKGKVLALDIEADKLNELNRRAKRAKTRIIETLLMSEKVLDQYNQWADIVLIDAPCSGLGTLKRNPEIKWNLTSNELTELQQTQKQLLQQATTLVQKKGKIIYATCSILPVENHQQTTWFLTQFPEYKLEEENQILAQNSRFDGFYMARFSKK